MLSKARIKFIKSLQLKKYRKQEQCFAVLGEKSVLETLQSTLQVRELYATPDFIERQKSVLNGYTGSIIPVKESELVLLGEYATNNSAVALVSIPATLGFSLDADEFVIMLDDIRDPGNLGTIIRTADWYGITKIIASHETADVYNSKVIQSSMGSFLRTHVFYTNLVDFLQQSTQPVYGALLDGENAHTFNYGNGGIVLVGNEANGISEEVKKFVTNRITIPAYGKAESLNAAIATAVILDNIRRR